jgi:hypothetical protein
MILHEASCTVASRTNLPHSSAAPHRASALFIFLNLKKNRHPIPTPSFLREGPCSHDAAWTEGNLT